MSLQITIMGVGWLGLPLYKKLTALGYVCLGSTTSQEKQEVLQKEGINVEKVKFEENYVAGNIQACLEDTEILILNTPPGLRKDPQSNYVSKIKRVIAHVQKAGVKKVLYISSTSVFEDQEGFPEINNKTTPNAVSKAGTQIREVEELLLKNTYFETTILRFSGLVDNRRHPATMMSKRSKVNNPDAPVNLIHKGDCIGIILAIIQSNVWGQILNASYPTHLTKKEYYDAVCLERKIPLPNFDSSLPSKGKFINGSETTKVLNYTYRYVV